MYNSLLQPHFDYCNVVWGNCGIGLSEKLQKLQNCAARILMSASYECNVDDLFGALGWPKLKHQRLVSTSIMMYKTVHEMTPEYLRFASRHDITSYRLRNTENKLACSKKTCSNLGYHPLLIACTTQLGQSGSSDYQKVFSNGVWINDLPTTRDFTCRDAGHAPNRYVRPFHLSFSSTG